MLPGVIDAPVSARCRANGSGTPRNAMGSDGAVLILEQKPELCSADAHGVFQHGPKYKLQFARR